MITKLNELNLLYLDQYTSIDGTIDMHLISSFITTIYSYFIKYPEITLRVLIGKNYFETFIQLTDLICSFNFYSTQQSKVNSIKIKKYLYNSH